MITPRDFVDRWSHSSLREQQGAQSHFNELCELVGHKTPAQLDPAGEFFTFEEQVEKATGGSGRADVWYRGHFAWEYKGKHRDLDAAYAQLLAYRGGLENPPLLVVCDFLEYRIYPQWANMSGQPFIFRNEDLLNTEAQNFIRWLLESPDRFRELRQADLRAREQLTRQLADKFAHLAELMRQHRDEATGQTQWNDMQIARYLTKLVFCLFAEDVDIMPRPFDQPVFRYLADGARTGPEEFVEQLERLFKAMDGLYPSYIMKPVPYFNGGLFAESTPGASDGYEALDLTLIPGAIDLLEEVSEADWRKVDPTIFGTLFEGALDPSKRAQLGAHFTSEDDIRLIVEPVLMEPLNREWDATRAEAEPLMQTLLRDEAPRSQQTAHDKLTALHDAMMNRLESTRVLDPACGSGNFLYVSLRAMKDLEAKVRKFFEPLDLPFGDVVTPRQLYGIEKDPFAAKLAQVVTWIGYLQWRYEDEGVLHPQLPRSRPHPRQLPHPILKDKNSPDEPDRIVCADSIIRFEPHPQPLPNALGRGEGEQGEGYEGWAKTHTDRDLYDKIKLAAREMRTDPTPAEDALWQRLRGKQIHDMRFRRQHPIDRFIVDFFCPEARLVVEVDGPIHDDQQEYDQLRQAYIESLGIRVLRFTNDEVLEHLDGVLETIGEELLKPLPSIPSPTHWGGEDERSESGVGSFYEPDWPEVEVIVGNPPFLGGKRMRTELGDEYVDMLFTLYDGRVQRGSDLVTYWFEKARNHIESNKAKRAGLLATNSIRQSSNREILQRIKDSGNIFLAWSDREWVLEGAAVRTSMVAFDDGAEKNKRLDGETVLEINTDLTGDIDLTAAKLLGENSNLSSRGIEPGGPFELEKGEAEELRLVQNYRAVIVPIVNAKDITDRRRDVWVIDFEQTPEIDPSEYKTLYNLLQAKWELALDKSNKRRPKPRQEWWKFRRSGEKVRELLSRNAQYICTPVTSKHRFFVWLSH